MTDWSISVAILIGILQGILEWLPVSSEGSISLLLTALGESPERAVQLSLFLHAGTGLAAVGYYRDDVAAILGHLRNWNRETDLFTSKIETTPFLIVATTVSFGVAAIAYFMLIEIATAVTGGAFIAVIGGLLVVTGILQRTAKTAPTNRNRELRLLDSILVGAGQGVAVLPGVSRSGMTVSVLLLRGYPGPESFRLSFLLSIPAAFGAGILAIVEAGGAPTINILPAAIALLVSAIVGYATIDVLMRVVRQFEFWSVCLGLGSLALVGGVLVI